jgi:hypothetical protein
MTTASLQPSSAVDRLSRHAAGAVLAVAVQALLLTALLLWAVPPPARPRAQKEIFFRLVPTLPPVQVIGAPVMPMHKPMVSAPTPLPVAPPAIAPPSGLAGFGQSLFGCTPEHYADLAPDARAHCIKPGAGLAWNRTPDLMDEHAHAKDPARWANARVHKQPLPMLPGGMLFPLVALGAVLDGSITEPHSAFRDPDQWPAEDDPRKFLTRSLDEQERFYDAWNRQHATAAADCIPRTLPGAKTPCPAAPAASPAAGTSP